MYTKERFRLALRWVCFGLLLTATALRLASEFTLQEVGAGFQSAWESLGFGAEERETQPEEWETPPEAEEISYPTMYYTLPTEENTTEEAAAVTVMNSAGVTFDLDELFARPIPLDLSADGPVILIVHTHASEAYTDAPDGEYRTDDIQYNVVRVGQAIADRLNANGIETLHDTTLNDAPGYNDAYARTAAVIARYLEEYPSIQMVIDVHRDAVADAEGNEMALTAELDGEPAAQLLLVMGTDASGQEHPNWQENLAFALKVQARCEQTASGVFRQMALRRGRYNEHLTPCSMLLEVGAAGNTLEEALRSAEFFGDCLAELLLENT